jgi:hypothetical protein
LICPVWTNLFHDFHLLSINKLSVDSIDWIIIIMYGILTRYTNQNMIKLWHWGIREINLLCNFVTTAVKKGQWTQYMLNGIWAYLFISIWPLIKYYFMWPLVWYVWSDVGFDLIFNLTFFRLENWVQQLPLQWAHQPRPGFKLFILIDFRSFFILY